MCTMDSLWVSSYSSAWDRAPLVKAAPTTLAVDEAPHTRLARPG